MSKKNEANFLEFIVVPCKGLKYETEDGKVTIFQENKGVFNFLAQKLLKKPRVSKIHLDDMGNFIWPLFDGKNDILKVAEHVKAEYGEKAEPLYDRLVQYIKTLKNYGFVEFKNQEEENRGNNEEK